MSLWFQSLTTHLDAVGTGYTRRVCMGRARVVLAFLCMPFPHEIATRLMQAGPPDPNDGFLGMLRDCLKILHQADELKRWRIRHLLALCFVEDTGAPEDRRLSNPDGRCPLEDYMTAARGILDNRPDLRAIRR